MSNEQVIGGDFGGLGGEDGKTGGGKGGLLGDGGDKGPKSVKSRDFSIFVSYLDPEVDNDDFKTMFEPFGEILRAQIVLASNKTSKCFGFINFTDEESVQKSITAMHDKQSERSGKRLGVYDNRAFKKGDRIVKERRNQQNRGGFPVASVDNIKAIEPTASVKVSRRIMFNQEMIENEFSDDKFDKMQELSGCEMHRDGRFCVTVTGGRETVESFINLVKTSLKGNAGLPDEPESITDEIVHAPSSLMQKFQKFNAPVVNARVKISRAAPLVTPTVDSNEDFGKRITDVIKASYQTQAAFKLTQLVKNEGNLEKSSENSQKPKPKNLNYEIWYRNQQDALTQKYASGALLDIYCPMAFYGLYNSGAFTILLPVELDCESVDKILDYIHGEKLEFDADAGFDDLYFTACYFQLDFIEARPREESTKSDSSK